PASHGRARVPYRGLADDTELTIDAQRLSADLSGAIRSQPSSSAGTFFEETDRALAASPGAGQASTWSWPGWLAIGCFVSLCWGFGRFGLALLAVARLRFRSRPLGNSSVAEEVELLRAELSCTRRIEIRESSELETPATLGWRQPLLLLPFDWRD